MFLGHPDPALFRTDPDLVPDLDLFINKHKKYARKTLMSTYFVTAGVNVLSKSNKPKNFDKKLFFYCILSATDETSRIRIQSRIRIRKSVVRIPGSGSVGTKMSRIHNTV